MKRIEEANKITNTKRGEFKAQSFPTGPAVVFRGRHLRGLLPEPTSNRRTGETGERKTPVSDGAATDRANVALGASSLHSNRAALRKRVSPTRSRNMSRPASYQRGSTRSFLRAPYSR